MTNNGFENTKSLREQINDVVKSNVSRREKINALIKLGIRENEVAFVLPAVIREAKKVFKYTFGVEIECIMNRVAFGINANIPYHFESYNHTDNREYFKFVSDGSLSRTPGRDGDPIECVSPVLEGNKGSFDKMKECCAALNAASAYVNRSTGLHVHIGVENMTNEQYVNVFKNYKMLEAVINTFMSPSRKNNEYAQSLSYFNFDNCRTPNDVAYTMNNDRYYKVNPMSWGRHRTIEFRQHQGTTNFNKIKNWVNFCAKLVAYSADHIIDHYVLSIDDIPFLTKSEKNFFKARKAAFETNTEREAA